jgi:hypothetical protein
MLEFSRGAENGIQLHLHNWSSPLVVRCLVSDQKQCESFQRRVEILQTEVKARHRCPWEWSCRGGIQSTCIESVAMYNPEGISFCFHDATIYTHGADFLVHIARSLCKQLACSLECLSTNNQSRPWLTRYYNRNEFLKN